MCNLTSPHPVVRLAVLSVARRNGKQGRNGLTAGSGSDGAGSGGAGSGGGRVGRRIVKWAVFTVGFGMVPAGADAALRYVAQEPLTLDYLLPIPNCYLIGVGIAAGGLSELVFDYKRNRVGLSRPGEITSLLITFLLMFIGGLLYAGSKATGSLTDYTAPLSYLGLSVLTAAASVYITGRSS